MITPTQNQLDLFRSTPGAISVHEMMAIVNAVASAPVGVYAEIGGHRGKSGVATAIGLMQGAGDVELHLVDPLYCMTNLEAWKHACQGHPDNAWQGAKEAGFIESVRAPIVAAGDGMVTPIFHGDYSLHAIPEIHHSSGDFAYVLLDSDQHQYALVKAECELLRDKMAIGGIIAFHDFMSQFSGVEQAYREMLDGGCFAEIGIDWQAIKEWVAANGGEEGNQSWHHCDKPAPTFFGAIRRIK